MTKEEQIEKEYKRIKKLYSGIPSNQKALAEKLIRNAAFMAITLEELQEKVNTEGAVVTMINGNGFETQMEHPAQKSYNQMINRFNATMRVLAEMLPVEVSEGKLAALLRDDD